jgi:hypothetical protein
MYLLCLHDFNEGGIQAKAGEVCWFLPNVAAWLIDSFPACWQLDERPIEVPIIETEAIEAPPVDKMMHAPHKAKARAEVNIDRRARARGALRG